MASRLRSVLIRNAVNLAGVEVLNALRHHGYVQDERDEASIDDLHVLNALRHHGYVQPPVRRR